MTISWDENLKIGVEVIDDEHQEIVEEFDRLYALMRTGQGHNFYKMFVNFLMDYVDGHLKHEEELMALINYDGLEEQIVIHQQFKDKVVDIETKHRVGKISNKDLIEINLMTRDWLVNHIVKIDMKLGEFIKENNIDVSTFK